MLDRKPSAAIRFLLAFMCPLAVLLATACFSVAETVTADFTASSPVPIKSTAYRATGKEIKLALGFAPATGSNLTVVSNSGLPSIVGQFSNLKQGQEIGLSFDGIIYRFVANYYGGSGNDLVLVWQRRGLYAWGENSHGQLGNKSSIGSPVPVQVEAGGVLAGKTVIAVAGGGAHGVAVCSDGTLATWGNNGSGQLGIGSPAASDIPVKVVSSGVLKGKTVINVSAGAGHTLALCSDGSIAAWGGNSKGQLGNGSRLESRVPLMVDATAALTGKTVVSVSAGGSHSLALCSDGTVVAWGSNSNGQLGIKSHKSKNFPILVDTGGVLAGKQVIALSAGSNFSLALCADGSVAAWGGNAAGQLGDGSFTDQWAPVLVRSTGVLSGKKVRSVSAGGSHSLARCRDGTLVAWGSNEFGQLGNGGGKNRNVPVLVDTAGVLSGRTIVALSAGSDHSFGLFKGGVLAAWGRGISGELGNNDSTNNPVPVIVEKSGILANRAPKLIAAEARGGLVVSATAPGNRLESLIASAGTLSPAFSPDITSYLVRLGSDTASISFTPTTLDPSRLSVNGKRAVSGTAVADIPLANGINRIAIQVLGADGQERVYHIFVLSGSVMNVEFGSPDEVPLSANGIDVSGLTLDVALKFAPATGMDLMVVNNTGLPFISGQFVNLAQGQLMQLNHGGINYKFVANYHGGTGNDLVLQWAYRSVFAWGNNSDGQLGNTTAWDTNPVPLAVANAGALSGKTVLKVAAGASSSLALCSDNTIAAWGRNLSGELGDGSTTGSHMPVTVSTAGVLSDKTVADVSAGNHFNIALTSDGTVAGWGDGMQGQLGNGSVANSSVPVAVDRSGILSGKSVVSVSAGYEHCLALCSDGTLVAWGKNANGQLGDGSLASSSVPVAVILTGALSGKTAVAVEAGTSHSLVLCSDGTLVAWGDNAFGQLGNGNTISSSIPVAVATAGCLSGKSVARISTIGTHNLALCTDGTLVAWGDNSVAQLGNDNPANRSVPVLVDRTGALSGKTLTAISAGYGHSVVMDADSAIVAWGNNAYGELGQGEDAAPTPIPMELPNRGALLGKTTVAVTAGGSFNLALAASPLSNNSRLSGLSVSSGTVNFGVSPAMKEYVACVPRGTTSLTMTPVVSNILATVQVNGLAQSSASESASIPLASGGAVVSIVVTAEDGTSTTYTVTVISGRNVTTVYSSSSDVSPAYPAFDATGSSVNLSLAYAPEVGTDLTVATITGLGFIKGQFSNLVHGQAITLTFDGVSYRFLADYYGGTGNDLVLHWLRRGVSAWGGNAAGQLGIGTKTTSKVPVDVLTTGALSGKTVNKVSLGGGHSLALSSDGMVVAWGSNSNGQLGIGSTTSSSVPVMVSTSGILSGKTIVSISAGSAYSLALCSDGTVAAWGYNFYGQLGNGTTANSNIPVAVVAAGALLEKTVVAISASYTHSLALCSDGTVAAWGQNSDGQLGNNMSANSSVPVLVDATGALSGKTVVSVSAGGSSQYQFTLALCSDGTVAAWGSNALGQLGSTGTEGGGTPVRVDATGVLAGRNVVSVSAGDSFSLAVCSDGTAAAWGSNSLGQLGNNSSSGSGVPVMVDASGVLSGKSVVSVSAGDSLSLAACSDGTVVAWGSNASGQLGDNTMTPRRIPVAVVSSGALAGRKTMLVESGASHSMVVSAIPAGTELSALMVSEGSMTPAFSSDVTSYLVRAGSGVTTIAITPTAREAADVNVNGTKVPSGTPRVLSLSNGINTFTVHVSSTGGTPTDYTITVLVGNTLDVIFGAASDVPLSGKGYDFTGLSVNVSLGFPPPVGTGLLLYRNTGLGFTTGQFTNLAQGQQLNLNYGGKSYQYVANYYGGTGNDLVLEWARRSVVAWGFNSSGQLGISQSSKSPVPVAMDSPGVLTGKTVTALATGANHSVALCADGTLATWGGREAQLGAGGTTQSSQPIMVKTTGALAGKTVVGISAAAGNNLAVCSDGTVISWGDGGTGQLGNGSTATSSEPVQVTSTGVLAGKSVVSVAVGGLHCLAVCSDGSVAAWGTNNRGQLGDGTTTNRTLPVLVSTAGVLAGKSVVTVSAGLQYCLALCSDGTLVSWGDNSSLQLGISGFNSTVASSALPVKVDQTGVLAGKTIVALSQAAHSTPVVLCSDGTMVSWGLNDSAQRGSNAFLQGNTPGPVSISGPLSGKFVVDVSSGGSSSVATCSDGTVVAWGSNNYGQLGNNSTAASLPVAVTSATVLSGKKALFSSVAYHALVVLAEPAEGYLGWAFDQTALANKSASADSDQDGIPNLMEYVLHGNPGASSPQQLPTVSTDGGNLVFTFNRLAASASDTTQVFQYSTDMIQWTSIDISSSTGQGIALGTVGPNGDQAVTITIPKSGKLTMFGRLKVVQP